jgi:hypothetical protein
VYGETSLGKDEGAPQPRHQRCSVQHQRLFPAVKRLQSHLVAVPLVTLVHIWLVCGGRGDQQLG